MGSRVVPPTIQRAPIKPNLAAAAMHETVAGIEVVAPVTVGDTTTLTIDATLTGVLTYVLPYLDPAGLVIDSTGPWTSPRLFLGFTTPPTAGEGVIIRCGMLDGNAPATDQNLTAGGNFDTVTGPKPHVSSHDVGPANGAALAGGVVADIEFLAGTSTAVTDATFMQQGRVAVGTATTGGTWVATLLITNDSWAKTPSVIVQIEVVGASANAAMVVGFRFNYLSHFKQAVLGG